MAKLQVQALTVSNWHDSSATQLRIYCDRGFHASTGNYVPQGSPGDGAAYQSLTLTYSSGASTLTIPQFNIDSTLDGLDYRRSHYSAFICTSDGIVLRPFEGFSRFAVDSIMSSTSGCAPSSPATSCCTWNEIRIFNLGSPRLFPDEYYTKTQINRLLSGVASIWGNITGTLADQSDLTSALALKESLLTFSSPLSRSTNTISLGQISLSSGVTGTLPIANGGTGSATQNFVDLSTIQTVAGNKNLAGVTKFQNSTTNEGYWSSTGGTAILLNGSDSSSGSPSSSPNPSTVFQTYRSGGSAGVGVFGYQFGFYKLSGSGDSYGLAHLNYYAPDMTGFSAGNYFQHGMVSHVVLNPQNIPGGAVPYGFNWFKTEKLTPNCYTVGAQLETVNNSGADAATDGNSVNSAVATIIAGGGTKHNSIGVMWQAGQLTSFQYGIWAQANSIHGIVADYSNATYVPQGTVAVNNGSSSWTGTGSNYNPEIQVYDFITLDGSNWYEVATRSSDTAFTTTTTYGQTNTSGQTITKVVQPLRLLRPSYILATDTISTFKLLGMDGSNRTIIDGSGTGLYAGSSTTQITSTAGLLLSSALKGTATNDSASAGIVGEYVESVVDSGSAITLNSGTSANLTSISLTAGDWDVEAIFYIAPVGDAACSVADVCINTTSATFSFTTGKFNQRPYLTNLSGGNADTLSILPYRINLSGSSTIYAVANCTFTGSGTPHMTTYGLLRARRVR